MPLANGVRDPYYKLRTEFLLLGFMALAQSVWAINPSGKNKNP